MDFLYNFQKYVSYIENPKEYTLKELQYLQGIHNRVTKEENAKIKAKEEEQKAKLENEKLKWKRRQKQKKKG